MDHAIHIMLTLVGLALILLILADGFETILLPRRVTRRYRYTRLFFRSIWPTWRTAACLIPPGERRETFLSIFGPLSLLGLFISWVAGLIFGYGLLHWSLHTVPASPTGHVAFPLYLYMSGQTFFTLGYGDVTPHTLPGRFLAVVESGTGFGFLAIIVSYLPVLYQALSQREVTISLLDARASSPPSAAEVLLRLARTNDIVAADPLLAAWERWTAELLESHLSFPILAYYRSQHGNQSWLAALTTMLDTSAFLIAKVRGNNTYQAQLTFAMARHVAVDLSLVLKLPPAPVADRLPADQLQRLQTLLAGAGLQLRDDPQADDHFAELRGMYEPFVHALAQRLLFSVPPIVPAGPVVDNWQRSAWMPRPPGIGQLPPAAAPDNDHFH